MIPLFPPGVMEAASGLLGGATAPGVNVPTLDPVAAKDAKAAAGKTKPSGKAPGPLDVVTGVLHSILGRDGSNKGQNGAGLGQFGDFDLDSFLESSLSSARGSTDNAAPMILGSLTDLIGLTDRNKPATPKSAKPSGKES